MARKAKILAVDDDPLNLAILEELLTEDYLVETAESGLEALELAGRIRPDLILLDIMMPGIDGYETCRRLRNNSDLKYVKIVLVSAKAMVSERLKGYESGADDYITKPFDHAELQAKVKVFLRLKSVEEMDEMKTDFLTLLAHETRTPLTEIIGPADLIIDNDQIDVSEIRKLVSIISVAGTRLHSTLERAMMLFSFRAGQVDITPTKVDLGEIAKIVIDARAESVAEKKLSVAQDIDHVDGTIADCQLVRFVIETLFDDCIAASPEDGTIAVEVRRDGNRVVYKISDDRAVQAPNCTDHLFEMFRVEDINTHSGTIRMDLPLAAEIVHYFGGRIGAVSDGKNGFAFRLEMPLTRRSASDRPEEKAA